MLLAAITCLYIDNVSDEFPARDHDNFSSNGNVYLSFSILSFEIQQ